jgi:CRISPR/Cas system-associated exonuclease Cas4 (RecB family)
MPYHTQNAIMSGTEFEKVKMAIDHLEQTLEDGGWVNMNEEAQDWLSDNAEDHGYVNMGLEAQDWLSENAEYHGYVDEDLLADAISEQDRLKDENDELTEKVKNTVKEAEKLNADGWKLIKEIDILKKENDLLKKKDLVGVDEIADALEMQEQYSQDADRCTEVEAENEELKEKLEEIKHGSAMEEHGVQLETGLTLKELVQFWRGTIESDQMMELKKDNERLKKKHNDLLELLAPC